MTRDTRLKLISVFLVSLVIIAYELAVMRSFAVGSWSTFGSMVISIALLGFGLAGTILTFLQKRVKQNPGKWLALFALLLPVTMAVGHVLAQQIPFNPKFIATDPSQWWWIGVYFLVYGLPFLTGAFFIGIAFLALSGRIHQLYFWNMAGSGVGGFFVLGLMYLLPTAALSLPLFALSGIAAVLCLLSPDAENGRRFLRPRALLAVGLSLAASVALVAVFGAVRVSEEKSISVFKKFPEYERVYHSLSPLGEFELYRSGFFHSAPGLSENFSADARMKRVMPENAFMGLYVDGNGPTQFMRMLSEKEAAFIDFLPMAAPYTLLDKPSVLLVRSGGGLSAFTALYYGAPEVTIVEPDPEMLHLLEEVGVVTDFNGKLLSDPRVTVSREEPRAFAVLTDQRFDLAEISLIDSVGLNDDGGYSVVENYTYTVEGVRDYMHALKDGGLLAVTVWNKLSPPRNVLRLIATVYRSLVFQGVGEPGKRLYVFDDLLKTATILVKNGSDFTEKEIQTLDGFCRGRSFEICYKPGIAARPKNLDRILSVYRKEMFEDRAALSESLTQDLLDPETGLLELLSKAKAEQDPDTQTLVPGDLYHFLLLRLIQGRGEEFFDRYVFDVRPATDDRPYYTAYLKPETVGLALGRVEKVASEWGSILLVGTFFQSLLFGALIIIVPLLGRWRELFRKRKGTVRVIFFFACLGLGYMLVEIFLIQRLSFFLADPIYSTSIVISAMLVISGLGSLFSSRISVNRAARVRIAAIGIGASLLFYIFLLSPVLGVSLRLPFALKAAIAVLVIAPPAFFAGMPFPTGLDALSEKSPGLLPWAWGMNGALSVTGAAVARLVSVSYGFVHVLVAALILYLLVGIIYPANEKGGASPSKETD